MSIVSVTGGVDTHADSHVAAAVDHNGGVLGVESFPADPAGFEALAGWLAVLVLAMTFLTGSAALAHGPTCGETLGIGNHGEHVIADYVVGEDGVGPTTGGSDARGGVAIRGGPGPGFHFPNGFAPGASFCTDSNSPGNHL